MKILSVLFFLIKGCSTKQPFHKENLALHTLLVYTIVCVYTKDITIRRAALLHDIGKSKDMAGSHGATGAAMLTKFYSSKSKDFKEVKILVEYHMLPSIINGTWASIEQKQEAQEKLKALPENIQTALAIIARADGKATL